MRRRRARRRRMRVRPGRQSGSAATSSAETPSSTLSRDTTVSSRSSAASSAHGATSASTAARSTIGSTATPASRRISRPRAWNVRTRTSPGATPSGATAASRRSVISSAARLLKVIAWIAPGGVPVAMSHAARATRVVVLPLPAGAMHSHGPGGAVAAACWSVASRARRSATEGWRSIRAACRAGLICRPSGPRPPRGRGSDCNSRAVHMVLPSALHGGLVGPRPSSSRTPPAWPPQVVMALRRPEERRRNGSARLDFTCSQDQRPHRRSHRGGPRGRVPDRGARGPGRSGQPPRRPAASSNRPRVRSST